MKSEEKFTCTFCSEGVADTRQGGEWHTASGTVFCCHRCAIGVLPVLIAESVLVHQGGYIDGTRWLKEIAGNFWKGMACRLSKKG